QAATFAQHCRVHVVLASSFILTDVPDRRIQVWQVREGRVECDHVVDDRETFTFRYNEFGLAFDVREYVFDALDLRENHLEPFYVFDFLLDVNVNESPGLVETYRVQTVRMIEEKYFSAVITDDLHMRLVWYFVQLHMSLDWTMPHFVQLRVW